jgi:hypothetical protein
MFSIDQLKSKRHYGLALTLLIGLGGCAGDHVKRLDAVAPGAGDAVARNKVAHMIDPWPYHAGNTHIHTDAERVRHANERYRKPPKPGKPGGNGNTIKLKLSGPGAGGDE